MKEAGAPAEPIVIGTDASQGRTVIANAVRAALQRIGLAEQIKTVPTAQFEEFYSSPQARSEIDVLVGDWYISKSDPMGFYDNALSDSPNNWVGFKTPFVRQHGAPGAAHPRRRRARARLAIEVQQAVRRRGGVDPRRAGARPCSSSRTG